MTLNQLYNSMITLLNTSFRQGLKEQGHYNTGALDRSINGTVVSIGNGDQLKGVSLGYGQILNTGVSAERIPYQEGSGAKSSKFIAGLMLFFKQKGLSDREAKQAAFATARKMKTEGSPTRNSFQYSKNGCRTRFIELTEQIIIPKANAKMISGMHSVMSTEFHKTKSETI